MGEPKVWKFSTGYAGITARGKRIFAKTKSAAENKAGVKSGSGKTKASTTKKRKKRTMAKKKKGGRRGSRIIGNVGLKGLLTGGIALLAADRLVPNVGGVYNSPIKEIAAGAVSKMAGVGGATLITSGAMKAAAITVSNILQGGLGAIGGGGQVNRGSYDY